MNRAPVAVQIRGTVADDLAVIAELAVDAFGVTEGAAIARLINDLVADPNAQPLLSLLAIINGNIARYAMSSRPIWCRAASRPLLALSH